MITSLLYDFLYYNEIDGFDYNTYGGTSDIDEHPWFLGEN